MLAATLLGTCFLDYWKYSEDFHSPGFAMDLHSWVAVENGQASAPIQYRVGVVQTAYWMSRHLHMGARHALALLDLFSVLIAAFLLYGLLEQSAIYRKANAAAQWFGSASFVLLVQFYLVWLLWYQRPETLPTTMLVTLLLWLWTRKGIWLDRTSVGRTLTASLIISVSLVLGFVRADAAVLINAGLCIACFTVLGKDLALPRLTAFLSSLMGAFSAGAVQVYLARVKFPYATYGDTPMFQIKQNLTEHLRLVPFFLFLLPYAWTLIQIVRRRFTGDAVAVAFVIGSLLYGCLWATVGVIREVRIFLPFAVALVPLTVQMAMQRFSEAVSTE